jgi:DNA helicase-2/ATP-dependent DNA helicase PcrA
MAARVVWLVANGLVRPDQVLGLTFTRKAARELAARVRRRLAQLSGQGIDVPDEALVGEPVIATYDAYAGRIVSDHALRLGREPGAQLITEAVAWQIAHRVVAAYDGPMDVVDYTPGTVVSKVLALHGELGGHLVEPGALSRFTAELRASVESLPKAKGQRTKDLIYADVRKAMKVQDARTAIVPMVEEYRRRKRAREVVDFSDQAELAARLASRFDEVGAAERDAYRVVLLDEYQDTSHAQLVLLKAMFGDGHPVTAVGDPCQSIYGWRGASSGTISSFRTQFPTSSADPARLDTLTTSFRNGASILKVANRLSEPLRSEGLDVPELSAFESVTGNGEVVAALHLTAAEEAADLARRARGYWDNSAEGRSVAVLVRNRAQIPRLEAALRDVDLPVEVVGVGGLLHTPEVADIVATLRVVSDPSRGDALMRLLTGSRWRLGPRDIDALARFTKALARRSAGSPATSPEAAEYDEVDELTIIDGLDSLPGRDDLHGFSVPGTRRLTALARELRALRRRTTLTLPELVHDVERTLGLGVEVGARHGPSGRSNLDRFLDVAAEFEAKGESPGLPAFLDYLDAAEEAERGLAPGEVEVSGDRVQILTVHGAKGLEWDAVFVTGMVDKVFPAGTDKDPAWLGDIGELPYPLRGDAEALPRLDVAGAADQTQMRDAVNAFKAAAAQANGLEERRLAYVAVTRARELLVCSGYRWDDNVRAREVSRFLAEIAAECRAGAGEVPVWADGDVGDENPLANAGDDVYWPYDPLGGRRALIKAGAQLVHEAASATQVSIDVAAAASEWDEEISRLLAERAARASAAVVDVSLPAHMSVSQLVQLREDPSALAQSLRRPVPRPPAPQARRGTRFHSWLESRWGMPRLLDIDELPGSADADSAPDHEFLDLQEAFLASQWANRVPLEVEPPFELFVGGVILRGRVDAVFETAGGGLDVVDWKTGMPPQSDEEEAIRSVQLAAYRLAFARLRSVPLSSVGAAFFYVRHDLTLRPVDLLDAAQLEALVTSLPTSELIT